MSRRDGRRGFILPVTKKPIFVRPLSDAEREALEAGLRSPDAFVLRRCQILLASNRGETSYRIARSLGCHDQTARNAIKRFNDAIGIEEAIEQGTRRPHTVHAAFSTEGACKLKELLHRNPRDFGKSSSLWTLDMAAEVSLERGLTAQRVSGETIRATLARLGVRWLRAKKRWITSPDPEYARKKGAVTD
ncbi:MAG: helix-turn-helix domain-containing protein [Actinomycetota bacterium]|nr:helix-turn-helix domain-containing protein [Actinomycetota bacterium]